MSSLLLPERAARRSVPPMHLTGIAAVDGAAALAEAPPLLLRCVGREHDGAASMPSASKKPSQNWCVDQTFRMRGMPTRSSARDRRAGVRRKASSRTISATLGCALLTSSSCAFTTRISLASSTRPFGQELPLITRSQPGAERHLAPRPPLRPGQLHVDERALAVHRAPVAAVCSFVVLVYSAPRSCRSRGSGALRAASVARAQRRADGAGLARVRMHGRSRRPGTFERMKSTCAFTTARLRCVPPCSTNLRPAAAGSAAAPRRPRR